jgi:peroxiredoxin Q/BCP
MSASKTKKARPAPATSSAGAESAAAVAIGKVVADFSLPSTGGGIWQLRQSRGRKLVLYFYPRDNTPGCTTEAEGFRDAYAKFKKLGVAVVGVSKDSIASHCKFRDKYKLSFPLLSDPDGKMLEAYGAWGDKTMYGKKMKGIIRSTVLLDGDGKVIKHWPKVSVKGHVDEVLAAAQEL